MNFFENEIERKCVNFYSQFESFLLSDECCSVFCTNDNFFQKYFSRIAVLFKRFFMECLTNWIFQAKSILFSNVSTLTKITALSEWHKSVNALGAGCKTFAFLFSDVPWNFGRDGINFTRFPLADLFFVYFWAHKTLICRCISSRMNHLSFRSEWREIKTAANFVFKMQTITAKKKSPKPPKNNTIFCRSKIIALKILFSLARNLAHLNKRRDCLRPEQKKKRFDIENWRRRDVCSFLNSGFHSRWFEGK